MDTEIILTAEDAEGADYFVCWCSRLLAWFDTSISKLTPAFTGQNSWPIVSRQNSELKCSVIPTEAEESAENSPRSGSTNAIRFTLI